MGPNQRRWTTRWRFAAILTLAALSLSTDPKAADSPKPGDDATYRPTVMIRREGSMGTGTIIASVEGETLILTAYHVIAQTGPIHVELYRFNFGVERVQAATGFPRKVEAQVIAKDPDTDLAILRIKGELAFPYVARLAKADTPAPAVGSKVTTIGFDKGAKLIGFATKVRSVVNNDLKRGGGARPALLTDDPPEVGRSGGGLFRPDGALVGVCTGRVEPPNEKPFGVFSTLGNVWALIRTDEDIEKAMTRAARGKERGQK